MRAARRSAQSRPLPDPSRPQAWSVIRPRRPMARPCGAARRERRTGRRCYTRILVAAAADRAPEEPGELGLDLLDREGIVDLAGRLGGRGRGRRGRRLLRRRRLRRGTPDRRNRAWRNRAAGAGPPAVGSAGPRARAAAAGSAGFTGSRSPSSSGPAAAESAAESAGSAGWSGAAAGGVAGAATRRVAGAPRLAWTGGSGVGGLRCRGRRGRRGGAGRAGGKHRRRRDRGRRGHRRRRALERARPAAGGPPRAAWAHWTGSRRPDRAAALPARASPVRLRRLKRARAARGRGAARAAATTPAPCAADRRGGARGTGRFGRPARWAAARAGDGAGSSARRGRGEAVWPRPRIGLQRGLDSGRRGSAHRPTGLSSAPASELARRGSTVPTRRRAAISTWRPAVGFDLGPRRRLRLGRAVEGRLRPLRRHIRSGATGSRPPPRERCSFR